MARCVGNYKGLARSMLANHKYVPRRSRSIAFRIVSNGKMSYRRYFSLEKGEHNQQCRQKKLVKNLMSPERPGG